MELNLLIYLIIGIGSFFIAGLILAVSLLIYYLVKLYKKVEELQNENSYLRKQEDDVGITNNALNVEDELSRRYNMYTPEPTSLHSVEISRYNDRSLNRNTKDSSKPNNVRKSSKGSVIDVSEEFNWRAEGNSKYNSNITLQQRDENELRTVFDEKY